MVDGIIRCVVGVPTSVYGKLFCCIGSLSAEPEVGQVRDRPRCVLVFGYLWTSRLGALVNFSPLPLLRAR